MVRRMRAVLRRVRQRMLRVDGRRSGNGAKIRGNGGMRSENGGVIGWNGGMRSENGGVIRGNDETGGGMRWRALGLKGRYSLAQPIGLGEER